MRIPGFRPGKVPMSIIKQRYGSAVQAEVLEQSLNEADREAAGLSATCARPGSPRWRSPTEGAALKEESDLAFTVELELLPEIAQPDLRALSLTRLKATPSDGDDRQGSGRGGQAQPVVRGTSRSPRAAAMGEILVTDFVGKIDGEAFAGGTAADVSVEVGGPGFIPGFTEQPRGHGAGQRTAPSR